VFEPGTVPPSGAKPGIVEPIKTKEEEKEQQQESATRTKEIVREEVIKVLSNRRKK
jgi:hypothetical protein